MVKERKGRREFRTISLPATLVEEVEKIVDRLRYWPTKTDFIREAVMEKLEKHHKRNTETRRNVETE